MYEGPLSPVVELPSADDSATAAALNEPAYHCPGEHYSISRAIHLARLASFYDKCRDCPHAHDDGGLLSAARRKQLDARPQPRGRRR